MSTLGSRVTKKKKNCLAAHAGEQNVSGELLPRDERVDDRRDFRTLSFGVWCLVFSVWCWVLGVGCSLCGFYCLGLSG